MLYVIVFSLMVVAEIVFVPLFLKKGWPDKTKASFTYKLICATAYVVMCIAAVRKNGSFNTYSKMILTALILSWLGDVLLHVMGKAEKPCFAVGALAFLAAHVFFVCGYVDAVPGGRFFSWTEIIVTLVMCAVLITVCLLLGSRFGVLIIAAAVYCFAVSYMCVKAWSSGVRIMASGAANATIILALLGVGGTCFLLSDFSLGLILTVDRFKNFRFKCFNIITYFVAQTCIAATVFFLGYSF